MSKARDPIDQLIGIVYETTVDPNAWQRLVEAMGTYLDGAFVHLHAHDHLARSNVGMASSGHSPEFIRSYLDYYHQLNPLTPLLFNAPLGQAVHTEDLIGLEELRRTEFYNDWFRPQDDCAAGCGMVLLRESGRMFFAGIHLRARDAEHKAAPTRIMLERLRPHMIRAMNLRRSLGPDGMGSQIHRTSLNSISDAIFHLDNQSRVVWMNLAAEALCGSIRRFRLDLSQKIRTGDTTLDSHIREICQGQRSQSLPFVIDTRTEIGTLLVGQVIATTPLDNPMGVFERDIHTLLVVQAPERGRHWQDVTRHFGLTAAEATLADDLVHGETLDQCAAARGTSIHTVRNQLRALLFKTSTNRQSEMVGLLAPFAAPRLKEQSGPRQ